MIYCHFLAYLDMMQGSIEVRLWSLLLRVYDEKIAFTILKKQMQFDYNFFLNRATGMPSCSRYLAIVRRAIG